MKKFKSLIKSLTTVQIVGLYNLANPKAQIQKFSDRATAEKRILAVAGKWGEAKNQSDGYEMFFGDLATDTVKLGFELPAPDDSTPELGEKPAAAKTFGVVEGGKGKGTRPAASSPKPPAVAKDGPAPPHLNLRCPVCNYYAKTTPDMMAVGRLLCPVSGHGILQTKEERVNARPIAPAPKPKATKAAAPVAASGGK